MFKMKQARIFPLQTILTFFLSTSLFCFGQHSDSSYYVKSIEIFGNKVTKEKTIIRELEFAVGDTIHGDLFSMKLLHSKDNLMNISLFNFVSITYSQDISQLESDSVHHVNIQVQCTERWYTWPTPFVYFDEIGRASCRERV